MKKFITLSLLAFSLSLNAATISVTIPPGGFSNVLAIANGYARVTETQLSGTTTNTSIIIIDTPTNTLSYVIGAYTNQVSFLTNNIYGPITNYSGSVYYTTNIILIDTNQVVGQATNLYPVRQQLSALAGTATRSTATTYYYNGMWATNNSSGSAAVTVTYQQ